VVNDQKAKSFESVNSVNYFIERSVDEGGGGGRKGVFDLTSGIKQKCSSGGWKVLYRAGKTVGRHSDAPSFSR